jgi:hypothetical protein
MLLSKAGATCADGTGETESLALLLLLLLNPHLTLSLKEPAGQPQQLLTASQRVQLVPLLLLLQPWPLMRCCCCSPPTSPADVQLYQHPKQWQ